MKQKNRSRNTAFYKRIKVFRCLRFLSFISCLSLISLFAVTLAPIYYSSEVVEATTGTPTASTLSFISTNSVASANLTVGSSTGTFATSTNSEKAAFNISTNNYTGYTVTLKSTGTNTNLVNNAGGDTYNISTISNTTTETVFSSSNAAGQALNNRWGYIPNYYNSAANTTNYYPAPTSVNAATLRSTSAANSTNGVDNADNYTIGLGFRADFNSPSGTYTNDTFILEFVANPVGYTISYDKNTTDTVTNMPATQPGNTSATSVTLSNQVPVRTDFAFIGWCFGAVTTTDEVDTCDGTIYNPNGDGINLSFGIDQTSTNNPILYAMWDRTYTLTFKTAASASSIVFNGETFTNNQTKTIKKSELTNPYSIYGNYPARYAFLSWTNTAGTFGNQSYQNTTYNVTGNATITLTAQQVTLAMQNISASNCTATARPVYDNRDNSVYWIQRLADKSCWMLDNLALDLTNSTIVNGLSAANTNLDATALSHFKAGDGSTSDRYPTSAYGSFDFANGYSQPQTNIESKNTTLIPAEATSFPGSVAGAYGLGQNKIGAYYNYCAASVGYYCFGNGSSAGSPFDDNHYDVCPAGWSMPTGDTTGEFNALFLTSAINSDAALYREALSTPLSGHYSGGVGLLGTRGYFWTSTIRGITNMYNVYVNATTAYLDDRSNRNYGYSVRCVLNNYMQDQTPTTMAELLPNEGDQVFLTDKRDNRKYTISKLGDDNYWMTRNLDLDGGTALYSSTSNVPEGYSNTPYYTLPASSTTVASNDDVEFVNNSYNKSCTNNNPCYSYYSFATATAGVNPSTSNIEYDICPKNWQLPSSTNYNELKSIYPNGISQVAAPFLAVYAGMYGGDSFNGYDSARGFYWTATGFNNESAYTLDFYAGASAVNTGPKARGRSVRCIFKYPSMQDQTTSSLATMIPNNGDTAFLIDKRDKKPYPIAKINGEYWMTRNLGISGTITSANSNFAREDFNVSQEDLVVDTTGNSFCITGNTGACNSYTVPMTHRSNDITTGTWYNYCAATAGTVCSINNDVEATFDICPLGWHLPSGPNTVSGTDINQLVGNTTSGWQGMTSGVEIFNPIIGGEFYSGKLNDDGGIETDKKGLWWTSTPVANDLARRYALFYDGQFNRIQADRNPLSSHGFYIRCVKETRTLSNISYMQEVSPSIIRNTANNATKTLTDRRDNKAYTVAKINGDLWMTKNLQIAAGTTLESINSNVVTSYTIPTTDSSSSAYSATADLISGNSYTEGRTHTGTDSNNNPTIWYNYCAASAGTVCDVNSATFASYSICPKGWFLPSGLSTTSGTDFNLLIGNRNSGWQAATAGLTTFSGVAGGQYLNGALTTANNGIWWSASANAAGVRYRLVYNVNDGQYYGDGGSGASTGTFVRCISKANK